MCAKTLWLKKSGIHGLTDSLTKGKTNSITYSGVLNRDDKTDPRKNAAIFARFKTYWHNGHPDVILKKRRVLDNNAKNYKRKTIAGCPWWGLGVSIWSRVRDWGFYIQMSPFYSSDILKKSSITFIYRVVQFASAETSRNDKDWTKYVRFIYHVSGNILVHLVQ